MILAVIIPQKKLTKIYTVTIDQIIRENVVFIINRLITNSVKETLNIEWLFVKKNNTRKL